MKEIYRSFEGKLDVDNQSGYIIYELKDFFQIMWLSVSSKTQRIRIGKKLLTTDDFKNENKLAEMSLAVEDGNINGQFHYHDKWYDYQTICKIQKRYQDYNWKKYV